LLACCRRRLLGVEFVVNRAVHRLDVVEHSKAPSMTSSCALPLWGMRMSLQTSPTTRPLQQTKRNAPASIWYELAPSWLLMRMISFASGRTLTCAAWRMRIMCFVYSLLPSMRLLLWATMKGSKPSFLSPRRTSMVGM